MTAGRGIVHSERSPAAVRALTARELSGIQTWLALPAAMEEIEPAFEHVGKDDLPVAHDRHARARIVMGSLWGETSPVTCHSPTIYADIRLAAGGTMPVDPEAEERGLYVAEGEATLDGVKLEPMTLYVLRPGTRATLRSEYGGHVMLCGGAPLDGPRSSGGISSPRGASGSARRGRPGSRGNSRYRPTIMTNSSPCPRCP